MSRNRDENEEVQQRAEPDQPLIDADETVERDSMKGPVQPSDAGAKPADRPDLDWAEHED